MSEYYGNRHNTSPKDSSTIVASPIQGAAGKLPAGEHPGCRVVSRVDSPTGIIVVVENQAGACHAEQLPTSAPKWLERDSEVDLTIAVAPGGFVLGRSKGKFQVRDSGSMAPLSEWLTLADACRVASAKGLAAAVTVITQIRSNVHGVFDFPTQAEVHAENAEAAAD